jgi:hypothetical protein
MSDPKDTVISGKAPEKESDLAAEDSVKVALPQQAAEQKGELPDEDLDKVAGGFGQVSIPQSQKNIGQSLTQQGRSLVSSAPTSNPLIKP